MALKPPANDARARFAALLAGHLADGTRPGKLSGERWTDAEFANEIPGRKEGEMSAPNRVLNWRQGKSLPTEIEPVLRALFGPEKLFSDPKNPHRFAAVRNLLLDMYSAACKERDAVIAAGKVVETAPDEPFGRHWIVDEGLLTIDPTSDDADLRVAANPGQQRFQTEICDVAKTVAEAASRPSNSSLMKRLAATATMIQQVLECEPLELPPNLARLQRLSLRLGTILASNRSTPPEDSFGSLDDEAASDALVLLQMLAPWLRAFPSVARMDALAVTVPDRRSLVDPALDLVRNCLWDRVVAKDDAADLEMSLDSVHENNARSSGDETDAATAAAVCDSTNLFLAVVRTVVMANFRAAPIPAAEAALARKLVMTLARSHESVRAFAAVLPSDIGEAIGALDREGWRFATPAEDDHAKDTESSKTTARDPVSRFDWHSEPPELPKWANQTSVDEFGRWASFSIPNPYGAVVSQKLRWIPPGRFWMGSPDGEKGRLPSEGPRHEVAIADGFWLFDTPCTQALWQAVMGNNPSHFQDPHRPVEIVSFSDAEKFLAMVNARVAGLNLSLPSEARWEYACRAGTETSCYQDDLAAIAWYADNCGDGFDAREFSRPAGGAANPPERFQEGTRRVGQKAANAWGLYDMLGNVFEWCEDTWHDTYDGAPLDGSAWLEPDARARSAARRVVRGGSWVDVPRHVRAAFRLDYDPDDRGSDLGFRCARVQSA